MTMPHASTESFGNGLESVHTAPAIPSPLETYLFGIIRETARWRRHARRAVLYYRSHYVYQGGPLRW